MDLSTQIVRKLLRNFREVSRSGQKVVFLLNYHRIGVVDTDNPFHRLHTVPLATFKKQIYLASKVGKFVSLADIQDFDSLDKINFCITFDDVSHSVLSVQKLFRAQRIPYSIAPCVEITSQGYGIRDRVYSILKNLDEETLFNFVQKTVGKDIEVTRDTFSFYRFTKSNCVDPFLMESEIIEPLFKTLPKNYLSSFGNNYLNWMDIRDKFLDDPLVTIVNHSQRHMNMTCLTRRAIASDINVSYEVFDRELGICPKHYAVPFGEVTQNLMYDLNEYLRPHQCQSVLWVHGGLNLLRRPLKNQILHLSRIHASDMFWRFCYELLKSMKNTHCSIHDFVPLGSISKSHEKKSVYAFSSPNPAVYFENIVRYGKDYASDEKFYDYCFKNNPYKLDRPDYYSVIQDERVTSIGYNFHMQFIVEGEAVSGVYWANWRKLPQSERGLGKLVVREALARESIIAIYRPSTHAKASTEIKWFPIRVASFNFSSAVLSQVKPSVENSVVLSDLYPESITPFLKEVNQSLFFSINRSPEFYRWRFDQYPLSRVLYLVSFVNLDPVGYFVVLYRGESASISDFYCESPRVFSVLLSSLAKTLIPKGIENYHFETSAKPIQEWIKKNLGSRPSYFENVYGFSSELFLKEGFRSTAINAWSEHQFHETQACGDVLLR